MTMPPSPWEWEIDLPKDGPVAEAAQQFAVHNMLLGAEILRDAAHDAVVKAARQRGWPCATPKQIYAVLAKLDSDELNLMGSYLHAAGMPHKIRYRYGEIIAGELDMDCWAVSCFLDRMQNLDGLQ